MIRMNPFRDDNREESIDRNLVASALKRTREALEVLVPRHQDRTYNIALRMVWNPEDAEDITQEVLIKIVTKLSTFEGRSRFRTWAYRKWRITSST